jgi:hypothetical protein
MEWDNKRNQNIPGSIPSPARATFFLRRFIFDFVHVNFVIIYENVNIHERQNTIFEKSDTVTFFYLIGLGTIELFSK